MILWGPPGSGKTTLARLMAKAFDAEFIALSAVLSGVKDIRDAVQAAEQTLAAQRPAHHPVRRRGAPLQQGAAGRLPAVRRARPVHLRRRDHREPVVRGQLARCCRARRSTCSRALHAEDLGDAAFDEPESQIDDRRASPPDRLRRRRCAPAAERGRDPARMPGREKPIDGAFVERDAGEEPAPLRQGRRAVLRPDLGAAQVGARLGSGRRALLDGAHARRRRRSALPRRGASCAWRSRTSASPIRARCALALDACETYERLGSPEGELALAEAVLYLAVAAKSNAVYNAYNAARAFVSRGRHAAGAAAPAQRADALMKDLGYGKDYRYAHDEPDAFAAGETYFPEGMPEVELVPADRARAGSARSARSWKNCAELNEAQERNDRHPAAAQGPRRRREAPGGARLRASMSALFQRSRARARSCRPRIEQAAGARNAHRQADRPGQGEEGRGRGARCCEQGDEAEGAARETRSEQLAMLQAKLQRVRLELRPEHPARERAGRRVVGGQRARCGAGASRASSTFR